MWVGDIQYYRALEFLRKRDLGNPLLYPEDPTMKLLTAGEQGSLAVQDTTYVAHANES